MSPQQDPESITYSEPNFIVTKPTEFVLHIQINRPSKLNAFDDALWSSLRTLFNRASHDPSVRAIVLSSACQRAFSAGLDITSTSLATLSSSAPDAARTSQGLRDHIIDFQNAISSIQSCRKPVICCLHGLSYGLAIDIASAADIRYATRGTELCVKEVDIGLAADIGSLQRLPKIIGQSSWLREMAMTAAIFGAEEAEKRGLVSKVFEDREACVEGGLATARLIAEKSPVAVQGTKFLLDYSRERTVEEGLLMTAVWNSAMLQTDDVMDAISGVMSKTPAVFAKL